MDNLTVERAAAIGTSSRDGSVSNLGWIEGRQLALGFWRQGSNRLLAVHHLHGIVKVEITGEASSSFRVPSQLLKAGSGVRLCR